MNHTPTSHAAQAGIDLDLDNLEALARAATPGPWNWWTSNSTLRLTGGDGHDGGVLDTWSNGGRTDLVCSGANQDFIAAANPSTLLELIALARNAACAAQDTRQSVNPAADEQGLWDAHMAECVKGSIVPRWAMHTGNYRAVHRDGWMARAALAQQAASPAPAAQAVDARALDARYREGYGDGWNEGRADLAASPAPETAQADDHEFKNFHRLLCERFGYTHDERDWKRDQLSLIEHIASAASPAVFRNDGREPNWDGYAAAEAHAQQDAAPAELSIGVSNNDQGVHINIMQRHADDSCTVLYAGKCPKGDSFGSFTVAAPSAATGKAAAANAGGLSSNVLPEGAMFDLLQRYASAVGTHSAVETMRMAACRSDRGEFASEAQKRIEACALREQVRDAIKVLYAAIAKSMEQHSAPATSAADAKDAERYRFLIRNSMSLTGKFTIEHCDPKTGDLEPLIGKKVDEAVDAAIAASQKGAEA